MPTWYKLVRLQPYFTMTYIAFQCCLICSQSFIIGKDKEVTVIVTAQNDGEPGHQCLLNVILPNEITLSANDVCDFRNKTYRCNFATKLETSKQVFMRSIFSSGIWTIRLFQ